MYNSHAPLFCTLPFYIVASQSQRGNPRGVGSIPVVSVIPTYPTLLPNLKLSQERQVTLKRCRVSPELGRRVSISLTSPSPHPHLRSGSFAPAAVLYCSVFRLKRRRLRLSGCPIGRSIHPIRKPRRRKDRKNLVLRARSLPVRPSSFVSSSDDIDGPCVCVCSRVK